MLCALVETATHRPSAHRYVLRGALFDDRLPMPRLDVAELVVPGDLRAEHGHDRLDDGEVDDLARAGALARAQRQHHARTPPRARDTVGQPERRQGRRAVGLAGDAANPLIASARVPKPGRPAYGPIWPKPVIRAITSRGLTRVQLGRAEPPALQGAGAEVLDQHVGVGDAAGAARPRRPACDRSRVMAALVAAEHLPPQPDAVLAGPCPRAGSGRRGCSTLTTSAPKSPRIRRGERAGEQRRDVEDPEPGQRVAHAWPP